MESCVKLSEIRGHDKSALRREEAQNQVDYTNCSSRSIGGDVGKTGQSSFANVDESGSGDDAMRLLFGLRSSAFFIHIHYPRPL